MMRDARYAVVAWALWLQGHHERAVYSEGTNRYANLNRPGVLPYVGDCSSTVRNYYNWAGAPDPYRLGYADPEGYTGTELAAGTHIKLLVKNAKGVSTVGVMPGDAIVYGPGTGWHTALIVEVVAENILTVSMGRQGDPSFVWSNAPTCFSRGYGYDGREPQTFLRFRTATRHVRWPTGMTAGPVFGQPRRAGLVPVDAQEVQEARANGWIVWGWDGSWFAPISAAPTIGQSRWVSRYYKKPRR